jgi:serine/threonine protein phosphatase PrpC
MMIHAHAASSLPGGRPTNEDAVWAAPLHSPLAGAIGVVADGMGGLQFGAEASQAVIAAFREATCGTDAGHAWDLAEAPVALLAAVDEAQRRVSALAASRGTPGCTGSTVCAVLLLEQNFFVVYAGDTRCYYLNHDEIRQLTKDQSLAAKGMPHVLTNSLGDSDFAGGVLVPTPPFVGVLDEPCRFLLVTDGVHGVLSNDDLHALVVQSGNRSLVDITQSVVNRACDLGSTDNVSCVLLSYDPPVLPVFVAPPRRWWQRYARRTS